MSQAHLEAYAAEDRAVNARIEARRAGELVEKFVLEAIAGAIVASMRSITKVFKNQGYDTKTTATAVHDEFTTTDAADDSDAQAAIVVVISPDDYVAEYPDIHKIGENLVSPALVRGIGEFFRERLRQYCATQFAVSRKLRLDARPLARQGAHALVFEDDGKEIVLVLALADQFQNIFTLDGRLLSDSTIVERGTLSVFRRAEQFREMGRARFVYFAAVRSLRGAVPKSMCFYLTTRFFAQKEHDNFSTRELVRQFFEFVVAVFAEWFSPENCFLKDPPTGWCSQADEFAIAAARDRACQVAQRFSRCGAQFPELDD